MGDSFKGDTDLACGVREGFFVEEMSDLQFLSIIGVGLKKVKRGSGKSVPRIKKSHAKALGQRKYSSGDMLW